MEVIFDPVLQAVKMSLAIKKVGDIFWITGPENLEAGVSNDLTSPDGYPKLYRTLSQLFPSAVNNQRRSRNVWLDRRQDDIILTMRLEHKKKAYVDFTIKHFGLTNTGTSILFSQLERLLKAYRPPLGTSIKDFFDDAQHDQNPIN